MEPFSMALGALGGAFLQGTGQEAGRLGVVSLAGLWGRVRRGSGGELPPAGDEAAALRAAREVLDRAARDESVDVLLRSWLREHDALPPARLAVPYAPFVNRETLLDEALAAAVTASAEGAPAPQLHLLIGAVGIGKTELGLRMAHMLEEHYPGHHLQADLGGSSPDGAADPATVLTGLLTALGVLPERIPAGREAQAALLRRHLTDRRTLILLDDAHSAAQVRGVLPGVPGSLTLVTSRRRLPELVRYGARVSHVGALARRDAETLLARITGEERFAEGGDTARAVARLCAGHPQALGATGARLALRPQLSWDRVARELTPGGGDMAGTQANTEDDGWDAVATAVDLSYGELGAQAAALHRLLGTRGWPAVGPGLVSGVLDCTAAEARLLLEELAGLHLLEETDEERYRQPEAARRHAAAEAARSGEPQARAVRRIVQWYRDFAVRADSEVTRGRWYLGRSYGWLAEAGPSPYSGRKEALDALRTERAGLVEAVRAAHDFGFADLVCELCEAMWGLHLRLGHHEDCLRTHRLGVEAAAENPDPRFAPRIRVQLGFSLMALGQYEEAEREFSTARDTEPASHPRGRATATEALGLLRLRQQRYAEAEECFRAALPLAAEAEEPRAEAILGHHIGRALRGQGRTDEALERLASALAAVRALGDRYNEGRVLTSIGGTRLDAGAQPVAGAQPAAGERESAREALGAALRIMTDEGALVQEGDVAVLCGRAAPPGSAEQRELWQRAHRIKVATGDLEEARDVLALLGEPQEDGR